MNAILAGTIAGIKAEDAVERGPQRPLNHMPTGGKWCRDGILLRELRIVRGLIEQLNHPLGRQCEFDHHGRTLRHRRSGRQIEIGVITRGTEAECAILLADVVYSANETGFCEELLVGKHKCRGVAVSHR